MQNNNTYNHLLTWEEKSIILGVIMYLSKHHEKMINKTIIIQDKFYRTIIKKIFDDLMIKKKSNSVDIFQINIKNNVQNGLIINNLNNLNKINNKKVILLPWYNIDNPIVMYKWKPNEIGDIKKFKDDVKKFTKYERQRSYGINSIMRTKHNVDMWDTYYEYKIIQKLLIPCPYYNVSEINNMINNYLLLPNNNQPIYIPKYYPIYIVKENINEYTQNDNNDNNSFVPIQPNNNNNNNSFVLMQPNNNDNNSFVPVQPNNNNDDNKCEKIKSANDGLINVLNKKIDSVSKLLDHRNNK